MLALLCALFTIGLLGASAHALVRRMMHGDREAAELLLRRVAPVIRARCRRVVARAGGAVDADDLVQEVWLVLLDEDARALLDYAPERGVTFEGYVGMVSERAAWKVLRKGQARKRGGHLRLVALDEVNGGSGVSGGFAESADPAALTEARDMADRLGSYLGTHLPPRGQLVFRYLFTDGCTVQQTATALGVSSQVVYNWSHRIRAVAREFMTRAAAA